MVKLVDCEQKTLVNELTQGKKLAQQLSDHLNNISSPEMRRFLVEQLLLCYDKTIPLLKNWGDSGFLEAKPTIRALELPYSCANSSSRSEVSDKDCKKRRTQKRLIKQIKVSSESSREEPVNDGHNWRKYGQKDILGANFPRGYYRCTHRHSRGCLATKRVQRSNQDPAVFEVTYKGRHTCFQSCRLGVSSPNDKSNQNKDSCQLEHNHEQKKPKLSEENHEQKKPKLSEERCFNSKDGVKSQDLDIFPSILSPGGSYYMGNDEHEENDIFKEPLIGNNLLGLSSAPAFLSPIDNVISWPEADSLASLINKSAIGDWDISIEDVDFDASFPVEDHEFLALERVSIDG